jgi:hypothetical protein
MIFMELEMSEEKYTWTNNLKSLDELYWFNRAHETWLLKGDNNTEFLHRTANGSMRRNTRSSLSDGIL